MRHDSQSSTRRVRLASMQVCTLPHIERHNAIRRRVSKEVVASTQHNATQLNSTQRMIVASNAKQRPAASMKNAVSPQWHCFKV
jgi:hypothetical protein